MIVIMIVSWVQHLRTLAKTLVMGAFLALLVLSLTCAVLLITPASSDNRGVAIATGKCGGLFTAITFRRWASPRTAEWDGLMIWTIIPQRQPGDMGYPLMRPTTVVRVDFWDSLGNKMSQSSVQLIPVGGAFVNHNKSTHSFTIAVDVPPEAREVSFDFSSDSTTRIAVPPSSCLQVLRRRLFD
jgi:hypothetical protein